MMFRVMYLRLGRGRGCMVGELTLLVKSSWLYCIVTVSISESLHFVNFSLCSQGSESSKTKHPMRMSQKLLKDSQASLYNN